jgi:hypothetical protein
MTESLQFIKLTLVSAGTEPPIWINPKQLAGVRHASGGGAMLLSNYARSRGEIFVRESPEEVLKKIEEATRIYIPLEEA